MTSQDVEVQEPVSVAGEQRQDPEQRFGEVPAMDRALVAQLVAGAREQGLDLVGDNGLLGQLTKPVLESALEREITDHLGYEPHERDGSSEGNSRNGTRSKTVLTKAGPVTIDVPRDRAGTFEPAIVRNRQRRLGNVENMVLSLSARGLTHGDISAHLGRGLRRGGVEGDDLHDHRQGPGRHGRVAERPAGSGVSGGLRALPPREGP